MAKATSRASITLELSDKEAEMVKTVLGQVEFTEGAGHYAESVWDALDDAGVCCSFEVEATDDGALEVTE